MHNINWHELRYIFAVAEAGSAAGAARALGVNHSTVVRHIQRFEGNHQIRIFDHLASGYRLTEKGKIFLEAAREIQHTVGELERKIASGEDSLSGEIRLTTTDGLYPLLVEPLTEFQQMYPNIHFELLITNHKLNLSEMEADIALRPAVQPSKSLAGRCLGELSFGIYGSINLQQNGVFPTYDQVPWIGIAEALSQSAPSQWIEQNITNSQIKIRCNSFVTIQQLVEQGAGYSILLSHLADHSERLVKLENIKLPTKVWLLSHTDMLRSPRIVNCLDFLESYFKENKKKL